MNKSQIAMLSSVLASNLSAQQGAVQNHSQVDICSVCDILKAPSEISCKNHHAATDQPHVTLAAGLSIQWKAGSGAEWSIHFEKSPCEDGRKQFDASHDSCTIRTGAQTGTYHYTVRLKDCKHAGKGSIDVVPPTSK